MVKCADIERGTVPKFFVSLRYRIYFFFYRFELRYYMGQQVCLFLWQSEILFVCP